jgi:hypothetical protein
MDVEEKKLGNWSNRYPFFNCCLTWKETYQLYEKNENITFGGSNRQKLINDTLASEKKKAPSSVIQN